MSFAICELHLVLHPNQVESGGTCDNYEISKKKKKILEKSYEKEII
jgi:hypothetical protein